MEINGVAHLFSTVSNIEAALPFHEKRLEAGNGARGYYALRFEDPHCVRPELKFVRGTGLLAEKA